MPSLNTLKTNFENLKYEWNINNLDKINNILINYLMKKELQLLKKKYKNL